MLSVLSDFCRLHCRSNYYYL